MDEAVADSTAGLGEPARRFFGAAGALTHLPQRLVGPDPLGTPTRADRLGAPADRAGYAKSEVPPPRHEAWRFYRPTP
jgi:hypothetical protein